MLNVLLGLTALLLGVIVIVTDGGPGLWLVGPATIAFCVVLIAWLIKKKKRPPPPPAQVLFKPEKPPPAQGA